MFTKSKIALSFAVVLSTASMPLATHAFAEDNWAGCCMDGDTGASPQNWGGERAYIYRNDSGNAYGFGSLPSQRNDLSPSRKKPHFH